MADGTTFVGLDVHVQTIALAIVRGQGEPEDRGVIENTPRGLVKRLQRLGPVETLSVCYEAGPCGYALYRALSERGIRCVVVAPSLLPVRPGDRVKTDRRDARKLARLLSTGDVQVVSPPTPEVEALRDLSRAREAAMADLRRCGQRLLKLLNRRGYAEPHGVRRWGRAWWAWVETISMPLPAERLVLEQYGAAVRHAQAQVDYLTVALETVAVSSPELPLIAALHQLHGVGAISAVGLVAELGDMTRFTTAAELMAYVGVVPREHSSGARQRRGAITKTGNAHARRLLVEVAWHYMRPINPAKPLAPGDPTVARRRLHARYWRLVRRGKPPQVAIVAVARELLGFMWSIARTTAMAGPVTAA